MVPTYTPFKYLGCIDISLQYLCSVLNLIIFPACHKLPSALNFLLKWATFDVMSAGAHYVHIRFNHTLHGCIWYILHDSISICGLEAKDSRWQKLMPVPYSLGSDIGDLNQTLIIMVEINLNQLTVSLTPATTQYNLVSVLQSQHLNVGPHISCGCVVGSCTFTLRINMTIRYN